MKTIYPVLPRFDLFPYRGSTLAHPNPAETLFDPADAASSAAAILRGDPTITYVAVLRDLEQWEDHYQDGRIVAYQAIDPADLTYPGDDEGDEFDRGFEAYFNRYT